MNRESINGSSCWDMLQEPEYHLFGLIKSKEDTSLKIYTAKTDQTETADAESLWRLLDRDRQQKALALKNEKERKLSILAGLLLRYAFLKNGYREQEWQTVRIEKGEYGKPYIKGHEDFHYSLSHSGEWVICVVDQKPVGVDIQEIKSWKLELAKRFYSKEEWSRLLEIQEADEDKRTKMFYNMWSAKESVVKMMGRGIGNGISQYITSAGFRFIQDVENGNRIPIRLYDEIEGYAVCVCSETGAFPDKMNRIDCDISQVEEK